MSNQPDPYSAEYRAAARQLRESLAPVVDRILAARGLTRADLPAIIAAYEAKQQQGDADDRRTA
jgi:hypothetical protein